MDASCGPTAFSFGAAGTCGAVFAIQAAVENGGVRHVDVGAGMKHG